MDISVIIPTYNERENIAILIPRLIACLQGSTSEIIVVDDDSPDGTWRLVEELGETHETVRVYHRVGRRGLSSAVVDGCTMAKGRSLVVMDADLQHDPAKVRELAARLGTHEIAIGTRYAEGGTVGEFGLRRRLVSRTAALACRLVLGIRTSDPMSGFFALRRSTFDRIASDLDPRGYKILMELLWRAKVQSVGEVGYVFGSRAAGESKLDSSVIFDYLWSLLSLRFGNVVPARFVKYALVGLSGVGVQLGMIALLDGLLPREKAVPVAIATAMVTNFLLNNAWTFRDLRKRGGRDLTIAFLRFALICGAGAVINDAMTLRWSGIRGGVYTASLIAIAFATTWNYLLNRHFTWRDRG